MKTLKHACFALSFVWIALLSIHGLIRVLHPLNPTLYKYKWINHLPPASIDQPQGWLGLWPLMLALGLVLLGILFDFLSRTKEKENDVCARLFRIGVLRPFKKEETWVKAF